MSDECGLCGEPVIVGGVTKDGVLLHSGDFNQIIGWDHAGDCRPIRSSCYRAWTVYDMRPEPLEDDCADR